MKYIFNSLFSIIFLFSLAFANIKTDYPEEKANSETIQNIECGSLLKPATVSNKYPPLFYPYYCHSLSDIFPDDNAIALEDGSKWSIHPDSHDDVITWKESDPLLIYPNNAWLSLYKYIIVNQALGTKVEVNMAYGPFIDEEYSLKIASIDYIKGEVYLNDSSRWKIYSSDIYLLCQWKVGDYLIAGSSNNWLCSLKNILINSTMYNHVRAQQF